MRGTTHTNHHTKPSRQNKRKPRRNNLLPFKQTYLQRKNEAPPCQLLQSHTATLFIARWPAGFLLLLSLLAPLAVIIINIIVLIV